MWLEASGRMWATGSLPFSLCRSLVGWKVEEGSDHLGGSRGQDLEIASLFPTALPGPACWGRARHRSSDVRVENRGKFAADKLQGALRGSMDG